MNFILFMCLLLALECHRSMKMAIKPQQLSLQASSGIPVHVAYIVDGNGRWGLQNNSSRSDGHRIGASNTVDIVKSSF